MIYIGSDHRGYNLKEKIKQWLTEWNYQFEDLGNDHLDPEDDFPDFALKVARKLGKVGDMGILFCGSGVGMDIVANRSSKVRCGLGFSVEQIKKAKEDNDLNCLALAADFIDEGGAKEIVKIFLETEFSGEERKKKRIEKIDKK